MVEALTFVADPSAPDIVLDLPRDRQVAMMATGTGFLGSSLDYAENIAALGITDDAFTAQPYAVSKQLSLRAVKEQQAEMARMEAVMKGRVGRLEAHCGRNRSLAPPKGFPRSELIFMPKFNAYWCPLYKAGTSATAHLLLRMVKGEVSSRLAGLKSKVLKGNISGRADQIRAKH